jgi:tripartite-type tricarboxylate transporter receptor subunit TctC
MPEDRPQTATLSSLVLALACALLFVPAARAQLAPPAGVWAPDRPVRLVVPSEAGGSTDVTARLIAERLGPRLGQPVVVENRPGAGGNVGWGQAARATPDGHSLVMAVSTMVANQALYRTLPFHPQRDFAPVSLTAVIPNLLVVHPDVPARDLEALIALARANPGRVNYGTAGNGTPHHLAAALLAARTGVTLTHVPYRGGAPAVLDLVGGKIQFVVSPLVVVIEHVRAGRLRALAVSTLQRSPLLPEVPTIAEAAGLPDFEVVLWNGVLAPAGTPDAAVQRLSAEIGTILRMPEMRAKLAEQGSEPVGSTPEEFARFIAAELPKWAEMVRISGASVD